MGLPAPPVPQAEQRRRGILEAVLRIVAAGGVDAVTHRRVAAEAGVPLGSTTYWFRTRDELLLEAFRLYVSGSTEMYADLEKTGGSDTVDSLARLLAVGTQRQSQNASALLAEYELILFAARNPDFAREYRAWQRTLAVHLAERLERLGAPRPLAAARTVMAAMRGFELDDLTSEDVSFDELLGRVRALLTGLLAAAPAPTATLPGDGPAVPGAKAAAKPAAHPAAKSTAGSTAKPAAKSAAKPAASTPAPPRRRATRS